jgi:hypothetical protein
MFKRPHFNQWLGVVAHACQASCGWKLKTGGLQSMPAWGRSKILSPKQLEQKGLEV